VQATSLQVTVEVADPTFLARTRAILRHRLAAALTAEELEIVVLVGDELLSLSLMTPATPAALDVLLVGGVIELSVTDHAATDSILEPSNGNLHRLRLLDSLSTAWGVDRASGKRKVWARLREGA
jgi:hypothetical protein